MNLKDRPLICLLVKHEGGDLCCCMLKLFEKVFAIQFVVPLNCFALNREGVSTI